MKKNWVLWLAAVLLVCLLPGMTREASAETGEVGEIVKRICLACRNYTQVQILRHYAKGEGFQYSEIYHWTDFKCLSCGQTTMWRDDIVGRHIGGDETPTCTTGKTCSLCGGDYGKLGHDWGEWTPNGNGTHSHACKRDGCDATETENCSGDSSASCVTQGTCTTCGGAYYGTHNFAPPRGRMVRTRRATGTPASTATKEKKPWMRISMWSRGRINIWHPRPPAFPRPSTTRAARSAGAQGRKRLRIRGAKPIRKTTT